MTRPSFIFALFQCPKCGDSTRQHPNAVVQHHCPKRGGRLVEYKKVEGEE